MPMDLTDGKSTSVQVMAWCRQARSHYLGQCWPRSLSPYGVIRSQCMHEYRYPLVMPLVREQLVIPSLAQHNAWYLRFDIGSTFAIKPENLLAIMVKEIALCWNCYAYNKILIWTLRLERCQKENTNQWKVFFFNSYWCETVETFNGSSKILLGLSFIYTCLVDWFWVQGKLTLKFVWISVAIGTLTYRMWFSNHGMRIFFIKTGKVLYIVRCFDTYVWPTPIAGWMTRQCLWNASE